MRKYITPPDMDIYKDLIAESSVDPYARYGGLQPGMTPGSIGLPYWLPEPAPVLTPRERLDAAKPMLAVVGAVVFVLGVLLVTAVAAGWVR